MEYDPSQFIGTARFYLRGRPPYSAELGDVLQRELDLGGDGHLADIGSGPGTVGAQLAALFRHVSFVEPDPDMLTEARAHASTVGVPSASFHLSTAEGLSDLTLEPAQVVTFGQSFHRTDRERAVAAVYDVLEPGGSIVLITHNPMRPRPAQPEGTSLIPHDRIRQLIQRYLGPDLRSGARSASSYSSEPFESTLARTPFGRPRVVYAPGRADIVRDIDSVVDNYLSMSFASPHLLGDRTGSFVEDLRALLHEHAPLGRYWDWPGDTELVIGTRPGPGYRSGCP